MEQSDSALWQEAALAVIKDQFGKIFSFKIHQVWGDRIVLEATTSEVPTGIVLKASAEQIVHEEALVAKHARQAGVPVPTILTEGTDDRLPGKNWFIMEKARGEKWESVIQTDAQRARTLDDIGHIFALLHRVETKNYGSLTSNMRGDYPSWSSWLSAELLSCSQPLVEEGYLPHYFLSMNEEVLKEFIPELDKIVPTLLHGDLGDGEVFVDPVSGAVTSIVDWGGALSGDPLYEFACFVAGGPADDKRPGLYLPGVKQAYAKYTGRDVEALDGKVSHLYTMLNTVMNARWCLREMPSWIEDLCARAINLKVAITQTR